MHSSVIENHFCICQNPVFRLKETEHSVEFFLYFQSASRGLAPLRQSEVLGILPASESSRSPEKKCSSLDSQLLNYLAELAVSLAKISIIKAQLQSPLNKE